MSVILNQFTNEGFDGETLEGKIKIYNNLKVLTSLKLTSLIYMIIFTFVNFMTSDIDQSKKNRIAGMCIIFALINVSCSIAIGLKISKQISVEYNIRKKLLNSFKLPIIILPILNTIMYLIYNIGESQGAYDEIFSLIGKGIEAYTQSIVATAQRRPNNIQGDINVQEPLNLPIGTQQQQPTVPQTNLTQEQQISILQQTINNIRNKDKDLTILQREHNTTLTLIALTFTFITADFTSMFPVFNYVGNIKKDIELSGGEIKFGLGATFGTIVGPLTGILLISNLVSLFKGDKKVTA